MNLEEQPTSQPEQSLSRYAIWFWLAPLVPLLILVVYFAFSGPSAPTTTRSTSAGPAAENGLETARQSLTRQADLTTCRNALQQINVEMGENPTLRPPSLTEEQKKWFHDHLNLSEEEQNEVASSNYTRLDHQHLFRCFLLRDAANALEVKGVRGKGGQQPRREKPLDQAARAFAWVMREVRLHPAKGDAAPPSFVVRRGWGTVLERALVFLALLEQLGDPNEPQPELLGFLLQIPNDSGGIRLWACGVVVGDGTDVYLFDPHLGLPLPGPKGEGIATLAQAREQPDVLAQLNFDEKIHYAVTAEQARKARAHLVCPLSALAPRMRYLQEKLLAPAVRARLSIDGVQAQERVKAVCSAGVKKPAPVMVAKDLSTLLYSFLPPEEGGSDSTSRMHRFVSELVPMRELPAGFRDERNFPRNSELGQRVLGQFAGFFYVPTMEPGKPRDQMLRGRYSSAVPALVSERESWRQSLVQRANASDLQEKVRKWLDQATSAYARLLRARQPQERQLAQQQVNALWEQRASWPLFLVLNSAAATVRKPEVDYQLGLCAHEQAEQLQARLDVQQQAGAAADEFDRGKAQSEWQKVLSAWTRFDEDYPKHVDCPSGRRLRGRAEAMLGNHKEAIASWKKAAEVSTDLEKLACLYLARQWETKHPQ